MIESLHKKNREEVAGPHLFPLSVEKVQRCRLDGRKNHDFLLCSRSVLLVFFDHKSTFFASCESHKNGGRGKIRWISRALPDLAASSLTLLGGRRRPPIATVQTATLAHPRDISTSGLHQLFS